MSPGEPRGYRRSGDGRELSADMAFVALGRRPDVADLGLERAGLTVDGPRAIEVDEFCRSAVPHVYAVGDAAGTPFIANDLASWFAAHPGLAESVFAAAREAAAE